MVSLTDSDKNLRIRICNIGLRSTDVIDGRSLQHKQYSRKVEFWIPSISNIYFNILQKTSLNLQQTFCRWSYKLRLSIANLQSLHESCCIL